MQPTTTTSFHQDFLYTNDFVYNPNNFICSNLLAEAESKEYGGCQFKLNDFSIRFRAAKITPTKTGQFVTLWKRIGGGSIQPYDISDDIDFVVVSVRKEDNFGQFIFSKSVLCKHNIFSKDGIGGKRAIRVYPPWDKTTSKQAQETQLWQLEYFLEIPQNKAIDLTRLFKLFRAEI